MILSKLEIRGFKSFGDKVSFHFHEGVTGIVGPNGSGKSNVVDAIRWVLGEQRSRVLRSDKMDNVIFNGTRTRKPVQMAEVSISFKNTRNLLPTQYTEVTVTRRFYRSGESEYLLNNVPCRLKDIQNLFMDTGIGAGSYAIIELKMVDEILNDQNNSRRQLFEEAAGVLKFKQRKKESARKLEETDTDLARVEDLLFEIEKNLKSLEKQAKQVQTYLKLKEDYQQATICLAVLNAQNYQNSLYTLQEQIQKEELLQAEISKQIAFSEANIEKYQHELVQKEKWLQSRQKALNENQEKIRQIESEVKIKQTRSKFLQEKLTSLQQQLEQDAQIAQRTQQNMQALLREQETLSKQLREAEFLLEKVQQEHHQQKQSAQQKKETLTAIEQQLRHNQATLYQIQKEYEINQIHVQALEQELKNYQDSHSHQSSSLQTFEQKIKELQSALNIREQELAQKQKDENLLLSEIAKQEQTLRTLQEELSLAQRRHDAKSNEYDLTKAMVENLEGFPQALVLLKKEWNHGKQLTYFSDIITTSEKFKVAIESFLEPYLNYLIVENESLALDAIQLLANSGVGKAHFFILEKFRKLPKEIRLPEKSLPEFIVPALEIVEYDKKYAALVQKLLQNVFICTKPVENLQVLSFIGKEDTLISLSGNLIFQPTTISGGSVGLFEGRRIGRIKNLEKLSIEKEQLSHQIEQLQENIEDLRQQIEKLRSTLAGEKLKKLAEEITQVRYELSTTQLKYEQHIRLLETATDKHEQLQKQLLSLKETQEQLLPTINEKKQEIELLEIHFQALKAEVEKELENHQQLTTRYNQQNLLFYQLQNKFESISKEIQYKEQIYQQTSARFLSNQQQAEQVALEIEIIQNTSEDFKEHLYELYEEKKRLAESVLEAEKEYYALRSKIHEEEKNIRQLRTQRENSIAISMQLQQKYAEKQLHLDSICQHLNTEFGISLEEAFQQLSNSAFKGYHEENLKHEIQEIRKKMDSLGAINYTAIEAYQEIKQRYEFINAQRKDLLEAKSSLQKTISEIETVARQTFMETFEAIQKHFIEVFRSLFTLEDNCSLRLSNLEDPLESPIEIIAHPKGKRPLTINQLSGGEKTLTAIALLFAIYLVKPAPFCIFDEVDAPLDDANIDKFNNIIRKFSDRSQFIIVTHNKRTMTHADVLYGITMLEPGISTVVPVSLKELN
ncbi:MAG: chromosome segregation protein SMC [Cytophagales bacterium]|nr:chromosome segregation protein SMC [Cytophagales bacterium]MDW8383572.1 chromosome segregation protein SMC [Flammeovirgaceae bacterium]